VPGRNGKANLAKPTVTLEPTTSAEQRDSLFAELASVDSFDGVAASPPQGRSRRDPAQKPNGDILATADCSTLTFGHTPRRRNKVHLKYVAAQPCLLCGRQPSDPHHLRFAQPQALGRKVSDEYTVPLCRAHHRQLHRTGNEMNWWAQRWRWRAGFGAKLIRFRNRRSRQPRRRAHHHPLDQSSGRRGHRRPTPNAAAAPITENRSTQPP
jgi:hypothetical protein